MSAMPTEIWTYLTVAQTADALNCSTDSVRRLIATGELRAYRFGRLIRIAAVDIGQAGRPVAHDRRPRSVPVDPPARSALSGKRPGETWDEWARRTAQGSRTRE
jgi:excisionase family DNA binding protein